MLRRFTLSLSVAAALVVAPSVGSAQLNCVGINSCSLNPTASLTIPKVVRLALTDATITLDVPDFSTDSLNNQDEETTVAGISVRANHSWTIAISSASANWTYAPAPSAAGGARAREDLEFQVDCTGAWTDVTASGVTVASGALTNSATADVCLRTNFPADYASVKNRPGTYTIALTLTLAAD